MDVSTVTARAISVYCGTFNNFFEPTVIIDQRDPEMTFDQTKQKRVVQDTAIGVGNLEVFDRPTERLDRSRGVNI